MNTKDIILKLTLDEKLAEWGASFSGYSCVEGKTTEYLAKYKYAVTIGIRLLNSVVNEITDVPSYTYFKHYRTVNSLLDNIALKGAMLLEQNGYEAFPVPASQTVNNLADKYSGVFQHKTGAVIAGLGYIGKSALFISNDYGPRVRLATILTDFEPAYNENMPQGNCGSCRACVDACPAMAITGEDAFYGVERKILFDAEACSNYMNTHLKQIGRGSVCGVCMRVCPKG